MRGLVVTVACSVLAAGCGGAVVVDESSTELETTITQVAVTTSSTTSSTTTTTTLPPTTTVASLPATEIAALIESVAPGCATTIETGQSDVTQYPAADLSQVEAAEYYGVVEAESCSGLFPSLFFLVFDSPESRVFTTFMSAGFGCVLGWTDTIQYVYGPNWVVDAPYWEGFPGEEVAQLTTGTFNFQTCDAFFSKPETDQIFDEVTDGLPTRPDQSVMSSLLGEG